MVKPAAGLKKHRKYRRGRGGAKRRINAACNFDKKDNKYILYHLNIRGLGSKRKSLENILKDVSPKIVTLNETCLRFKQKPKLENYVAFNRNRTKQIMGGVATFVQDKDKDSFVKICEGAENDEFLVTRHSNFATPLNIINCYGEQESRYSKLEVEERWGRLLKEIKKIETRNEFVLVLGDMNKHIGNDHLGVYGNHDKISPGGQLIRDFLSSGDYICLNNTKKAVGGPFTRFDPCKPNKIENMSCLSLAIVSRNLEPFIEKLEIDSGKKFSPVRPISKTKSITSDHFPLMITFVDSFCTKTHVRKPECFTMWNTNKEGGWDLYKEMTEDDDKFKKAFVNNDDNNDMALSSTETMERIDKIMNKVKYSAFGKVKRKTGNKMKENDAMNKKPEEVNAELLELQRKEIESELKKIEDIKQTKGKSAAVFNVLNKVRGQRKNGAELVAMKDPDSDDMIFDPEALKSAAINYCANLLQNEEIDPDFEKEIYVENLVHYLRSKEESPEDDNFDITDFSSRMKKIAGKHSEKYRFLLKAGQGFQNCMFKLCEQVWKSEQKPEQWRNTIIVQLYKGKGEISDFSNQRNIHTKEYTPKCFEGILVDKSKEKIVSTCSKFQIGGIPKHRSQENLFSVKSTIALYSMLDLPLYIQVFDISKYFDKEILKDAMDTLYKCGVKGKLYRLWYDIIKICRLG